MNFIDRTIEEIEAGYWSVAFPTLDPISPLTGGGMIFAKDYNQNLKWSLSVGRDLVIGLFIEVELKRDQINVKLTKPEKKRLYKAGINALMQARAAWKQAQKGARL